MKSYNNSKLSVRRSKDSTTSTIIIFINNRLVECPDLQNSLKYLADFIYLSLSLPASTLDVNVHPSKKVVKFLFHDRLVFAVVNLIESKYISHKPCDELVSSIKKQHSTSSLITVSSNNNVVTAANKSQSHVFRSRTDPMQKQLLFSTTIAASSLLASTVAINENNVSDDLDAFHSLNDTVCTLLSSGRDLDLKREWRECNLLSLNELRSQLTVNSHCIKLFKQLVYVGMVNDKSILVQLQNELLFGNFALICSEMFYQIILSRFGNFNRIVIHCSSCSPTDVICNATTIEISKHVGINNVVKCGLRISGILQHVLANDRQLTDLLADKLNSYTSNIEESCKHIMSILFNHQLMLDDYFSIQLDLLNDNNTSSMQTCSSINRSDDEIQHFQQLPYDLLLVTLPDLIPGYTPQLSCIPYFLCRLALKVNWQCEKDCLHDIAKELILLYKFRNIHKPTSENDKQSEQNEDCVFKYIFPMIKQQFKPSLPFTEYFQSIVRIPDLFKVFERC
ncbi:hypothetical protein GJ496_004155 [Pomphorhynchus laevis]|nr:hypothetical protein GJ496_004155 [Pomphorhynchus laevis]